MRAPLGLVAGCALALASCDAASGWLSGESGPASLDRTTQAAAVSGIAGTSEWSGTTAKAERATFLVARGEAEWTSMWALAGQEPPAPLPDNLMAFAVFAGIRNSGGYAVRIEQVSLEQPFGRRASMLVIYRETAPQPGEMATMALTSPWTIRLVERTDLPVRFARFD